MGHEWAKPAERLRQKNQKVVSGYLKTLDGWRTLAVAAVILHHTAPSRIGFLRHLQDLGARGVSLFFAISGILICSRLLEEERIHGQISLTGFYIRRVCRIQPPAILFLLALGAFSLFGIIHLTLGAWLSALLSFHNLYLAFTAQFSDPGNRYVGHFWSLSVEEHFYLVLPILLVLAKTRRVLALGILSTFFFLWTSLVHHVGILQTQALDFRTDMAARNLLVAALLAVLLATPSFRSAFVRWSRHNALVVLTFGTIVVAEAFLRGHLTDQACCIGFPLMIANTMMHPESWLGRLLETKPLTFLGRLSYSIYLWQQLFFRSGLPPDRGWLGVAEVWPWNLAALMVCAVGSYYLIEKPFIRLGHRLAPPATSGRADLREVLTGDLFPRPELATTD